jgi:hypothetical protein
LTLQTGDNVGDYQVGEITRDRVTLMGRGGQEFSLELSVGKGVEGSPAPPVRPVPAAAPAPAQTAAQRAAAARRQQAQQQARTRAAQARAGGEEAAVAAENDPTQARLEALKKLREAASRQ